MHLIRRTRDEDVSFHQIWERNFHSPHCKPIHPKLMAYFSIMFRPMVLLDQVVGKTSHETEADNEPIIIAVASGAQYVTTIGSWFLNPAISFLAISVRDSTMVWVIFHMENPKLQQIGHANPLELDRGHVQKFLGSMRKLNLWAQVFLLWTALFVESGSSPLLSLRWTWLVRQIFRYIDF